MSEMIERVAAVITEAIPFPLCGDRCTCASSERLACMTGASATEIARAVIEAMREPTADMAIAGSGVWHGHPMTEVAAEDWRKIIDVALRIR